MPKFLTDADRRDIVDKIMADIPKRDPKKVAAEFQAKLIEAMPPEMRVVAEKYPDALKKETDSEINGSYTAFIVGGIDRFNGAVYQEIAKPYYEEQSRLENTRAKLRGMFDTVRTLASLHESFPDFKKYFPPIETLALAKRKKKESLTTEELQALLDERRKQEEKQAMKVVNSFGIASELAQMGWTPDNK